MEEIKKEGKYTMWGWESIIKLNKQLIMENKRVNGTLLLHCTSCGEKTGNADCYGKCHICTSAF